MSFRRNILRNLEKRHKVRRVILEACSGKDAKKFVQKYPDAEITLVHIPGSNGLEMRLVAWRTT